MTLDSPTSILSINELWDRDPRELSDTQIDRMVEEFRTRRAQFKAGNQTAGKVVAAPKAPTNADPAKAQAVLKGLGL